MVFGEYVVDLAVFDSINGIIFLVAFSECKFKTENTNCTTEDFSRNSPNTVVLEFLLFDVSKVL